MRPVEVGRENGMGNVWKNEIGTATGNKNKSGHGWVGRVEMMMTEREMILEMTALRLQRVDGLHMMSKYLVRATWVSRITRNGI